jgi:hypothetical protein
MGAPRHQGGTVRKFITALASAAAITGGMAAVPGRALAETCSSGYVHAVIEGQQKCLHAGEFCISTDNRQYHRYGFTCVLYPSGYHHLKYWRR